MSAADLFLPTCREVTDLLSEYMEGGIPWNKQLGFHIHLGMCPACKRFLDSLRAMPGLLKRALEAETAPATSCARQALDAALARIGQPRIRTSKPAAVVPEPFAEDLAEGRAGRTLRLLAETQRRLAESGPPAGPPFLPMKILAQLPPEKAWRWISSGLGGAKVASLGRDEQAELFLMNLQPGGRFPRHTHRGRESILLLQGGLEDGDRHHGPGEWAVHHDGSAHAPSADSQGCWALARLEGDVVFSGWRGLLQRLSR
jgi:anti-sigma factor ChrR (cupin superfamily)